MQNTKQFDFMVALGTHPPLSEESLHYACWGSTSVLKVGRIGDGLVRQAMSQLDLSARGYHCVLKFSR